MKTRLLIEGMMPQRAINRLRREGICLKNVEKRKKNQIVLTVDEKDIEKVFAIYPNVCYNSDRYTAYIVRIMPAFGVKKLALMAGKRIGLWVGCAVFLLGTLFSDSLVLRIQMTGDRVHSSSVLEILERYGVEKYKGYPKENADLIAAEILRLNGVGFCALRKVGSTLVVEIRTSPFAAEGGEDD